ncbi:hypothetical protein T459_08787 [Capsicum annuum]|uniref:Rab-GAP TBC domain-containing protein n=1 Tax=Capsicum annuum TaxID=4072 RepID=A0A2G2ZXK4_CAPAN|nr:putative 60S ribosomal protein L14-like [Capsicum annuum]PHT86681.1 hypothetical protein T459_08787 [Capsicum annuum]
MTYDVYLGLDVVRTDRTLVFYENEANQAKLWDVLAVYAWMDKDIGYVQGMSDICSPMIILLENEADAYWCFERAMRRLRDNFKCSADSVGVQSQLGTLAQIVKTVDPKLHQHLEELDGGEYLFAFRMLMVLFRREFSFVDSLYLWEVMWAMEYNPNIYSSYDDKRQTLLSELLYDDKPGDKHKLKEYGKFERNNLKTGAAEQNSALSVFLVASVLETKHRRLMKEAKGLDDVVQILGEISGNLDARKALDEALKIGVGVESLVGSSIGSQVLDRDQGLELSFEYRVDLESRVKSYVEVTSRVPGAVLNQDKEFGPRFSQYRGLGLGSRLKVRS